MKQKKPENNDEDFDKLLKDAIQRQRELGRPLFEIQTKKGKPRKGKKNKGKNRRYI